MLNTYVRRQRQLCLIARYISLQRTLALAFVLAFDKTFSTAGLPSRPCKMSLSGGRTSRGLVTDGRRPRPDARQCFVRLPPLSYLGPSTWPCSSCRDQDLAEASLHLDKTSPHSSDLSFCISHEYIFADQNLVSQHSLCLLQIPCVSGGWS